MEDHIQIRPDRSLVVGRQTSKWSLWDVHQKQDQTYQLPQIDPKFIKRPRAL